MYKTEIILQLQFHFWLLKQLLKEQSHPRVNLIALAAFFPNI